MTKIVWRKYFIYLILMSIFCLTNVSSKKIEKNFDDDDLYIHIKQNVKIFTTFVRDDVYIINYINFESNKFAMTIVIILMIKSIMTIFLSTLSIITSINENYTNSFDSMSMQLNDSNHNYSSFENNTFLKKRDLYIFWHRRFDHLNSTKFKNLHKITRLKKLIFIIEQREFCEIYSVTKMINKRNRRLIERKTQFWS